MFHKAYRNLWYTISTDNIVPARLKTLIAYCNQILEDRPGMLLFPTDSAFPTLVDYKAVHEFVRLQEEYLRILKDGSDYSDWCNRNLHALVYCAHQVMGGCINEYTKSVSPVSYSGFSRIESGAKSLLRVSPRARVKYNHMKGQLEFLSSILNVAFSMVKKNLAPSLDAAIKTIYASIPQLPEIINLMCDDRWYYAYRDNFEPLSGNPFDQLLKQMTYLNTSPTWREEVQLMYDKTKDHTFLLVLESDDDIAKELLSCMSGMEHILEMM